MNYLTRLVIILLFSTLIYTLNLDPVTISPVIVNEINFKVEDCNSDVIITMILQKLSSDFNELSRDFVLRSVAKDISLAIGIPNNQLHHMRWELMIDSNFGILKIFSIDADINIFDVKMIGKYTKLQQYIPTQYETIEKCSHSGNRRYGLFGPRGRECYTHTVSRALSPNEISQVNQNLLSRVSDVKLLMKK